jgi:murein DD-endopeptidase MepM/ murein hydrolase activator NlpD
MDTKSAVLMAICLPFFVSCASHAPLAKKDEGISSIVKKEQELNKNVILACAEEREGAFHIVGPDETLQQICEVYALNLSKVAEINRIQQPYSIKEGDTVFLPSDALLPDAETVCAQLEPPEEPKDKGLKRATRKTVTNALLGKKDSSVPELKFPVPGGVLTSPFGYRWGRLHKGLDIAANVGHSVLACADGRVIFTGTRKKFRRYGNTVLIDHGKGVYTYYAHLSDILVKKNQSVKKGQKIALVGNTGRSTGPHLHLEVRVANTMHNPLAYFSPKEITGTLMAGRFREAPMGPVRAKWKIPDLLAAGK